MEESAEASDPSTESPWLNGAMMPDTEEIMLSRKRTNVSTAAIAALAIGLSSAPALAGDIVGLITKTNTNPFFVKMKEGFDAKAKELGLTPQSYAGKVEGDNDSQVAAIESLISAGAKGILLVPSDSAAIVPTVDRARKAGILVITLDTPLDPVKDPKHFSQSDSPQIIGSDVTEGAVEGGRKAMENIIQKAADINLVYAANELSADGGYFALKAAGKQTGVLIVDIDGGCHGVKMVKQGIVGADAQQYPLLMASDGVEAIAEYLKSGKKPVSIDSGETLITDHPVPGIPSITADAAAKLCWG
jgi:fructose transport system substrate-binding protein